MTGTDTSVDEVDQSGSAIELLWPLFIIFGVATISGLNAGIIDMQFQGEVMIPTYATPLPQIRTGIIAATVWGAVLFYGYQWLGGVDIDE